MKNTKTVKTDKAEKSVTSFNAVKQVYRNWKTGDLAGYQGQGEYTCCAMRKGNIRFAEKSVVGNEIMLREKCAQGIATFKGKNGKGFFAAGKLEIETEKTDKFFANELAFAQFIWTEGEKSELYGIGKNLRIIAGSKYSFLSDSKKVWRHESNTCARGKAFFSATFK